MPLQGVLEGAAGGGEAVAQGDQAVVGRALRVALAHKVPMCKIE